MSKEFSGQKACIAPEGVFIIGTYDENGVPNAMNAAWGCAVGLRRDHALPRTA